MGKFGKSSFDQMTRANDEDRYFCIVLRAQNDLYGNPRQVVLFFNVLGERVWVEDIGYSGWSQIAKDRGFDNSTMLGIFDTTVEQYKLLANIFYKQLKEEKQNVDHY